MTDAADQLKDLAGEFNDLREEAAFLRKRLDRIGPKITAMRPRLADLIRAAAAAGQEDVEIAATTGYTVERVRQILRGEPATEREDGRPPAKSSRAKKR